MASSLPASREDSAARDNMVFPGMALSKKKRAAAHGADELFQCLGRTSLW